VIELSIFLNLSKPILSNLQAPEIEKCYSFQFCRIWFLLFKEWPTSPSFKVNNNCSMFVHCTDGWQCSCSTDDRESDYWSDSKL